jgi:SAM-dependent methyltransferase
VFVPYYSAVLADLRCQSLVEVGCGTGNLSKHMAGFIPIVYALEPSPGMYRIAAKVLDKSCVRLTKSKLENYDPGRKFSCVISHLCVHVVPHFEAFLGNCANLLARDGTLIFSIPHPCFWNEYQAYFDPKHFDYVTAKFTFATLTISKDRSERMTGLPFHHRPLSQYVDAIARLGLRICKFDEIYPSRKIQLLYPAPWKRPHFGVFQAIKT